MNKIQVFLLHYDVIVMLMRLTLLLTLVLGWPQWVDWLGRYQGWSSMKIKTLQEKQWALALWLIGLEMLLGQQIIENIFRLLLY